MGQSQVRALRALWVIVLLTFSTPSRVKSFMRQDQIANELDAFNQILDTHVTKFQASRIVHTALFSLMVIAVDRVVY